jgi:coenzyme F420-dependent glucose-6-phosphate dehydrogenase
VRESLIISADPSAHVDRVREVEKLGATIVALMNVSGNAPHDAIRVYGGKVLPSLRGGRTA